MLAKVSTHIPAHTKGLDVLVDLLVTKGANFVQETWHSWFEPAVKQLENDDTLDVRLTDVLAEALEEAETAIGEGGDGREALDRLVALYGESRDSHLEDVWRQKASLVNLDDFDLPLWQDLGAALDATSAGHTAPVAHWIDAVEAKLLTTWESYESGDVMEDEITTESVLCHQYLMDGVELWLAALNLFRETLELGPDRAEILKLAESGQRALIFVELVETETEEFLSDCLSWARN